MGSTDGIVDGTTSMAIRQLACKEKVAPTALITTLSFIRKNYIKDRVFVSQVLNTY
jgi:hypothetical protein